ncbi:MAG: hypothetical protein OXD30_14645 [Bryobacterales bacterium]|nr:hypothetical protein [Bryobacterales bacterium]
MPQAMAEREVDSIPTTRSTKQRIPGVAAILPGVLRSPAGKRHFHGSPAHETNWSLNGFSVSAPYTGRLEITFGAESIQSLDLAAGRHSAGTRKGTGGAMAL